MTTTTTVLTLDQVAREMQMIAHPEPPIWVEPLGMIAFAFAVLLCLWLCEREARRRRCAECGQEVTR